MTGGAPSLYRQYLAADWLSKKVEELGYRLGSVTLNDNHWTSSFDPETAAAHDLSYGFMFHVAAEVKLVDADWKSPKPDQVELAAEELLFSIPGARVARNNGNIYLYGQAPGYVNQPYWHITLGRGECEVIQVGTRTVMRPDPNAPLVEVVEPILETRCMDPIAAAMQVREDAF